MKILFALLELSPEGRGGNLYSDLAEEFARNGHEVTIVCPTLKRQKTGLYTERSMRILRVKTIESRLTRSFLMKGIAWFMLPFLFKIAYTKFLKKDQFDVVFMPTPPITLIDFVDFVRSKSGGYLYLILRDIHPESINSIRVSNIFINIYLRNKAQKAYSKADFIGCMSPGNIKFVQGIAPKINFEKICLLPNWINFNEFVKPSLCIRKKYNLEEKIIAVFGGTIGVGQGVYNIVKLADKCRKHKELIFLIVGRGPRKQLLMNLANKAGLENIIFLEYMPRNEYQTLLSTADIGLISLDQRYIVPTCPSKVIGYMSQKIPVFAMINAKNDYGSFYIDNAQCGFWISSLENDNFHEGFNKLVENSEMRKKMGENGYKYYITHFTTEKIYDNILKQLKSRD